VAASSRIAYACNTVTPSWDFVIDRLPEDPRIVIAGGFSGHGFKFAPAIGRMVAELALDRGAVALRDFAIATHRSAPPRADPTPHS
jgi:glycine/D-amino acid oxidase-like deaminating enzyme